MSPNCQKNKCRVNIRVAPNAKHEGWSGLWNGTHYKIALTAPAVDGKANEALISFLSKETHLPKRAFTIVSGQTNRCKVIEIEGLDKLEPPNQPSK